MMACRGGCGGGNGYTYINRARVHTGVRKPVQRINQAPVAYSEFSHGGYLPQEVAKNDDAENEEDKS